MNIGIIGYGYWGSNLVRNISALAECSMMMVSDLKQERLELVRKRYPSAITTSDPDEIISHPKIDAVVISTPVFTHFPLARKALLKGKNVLIEKPMTTTSDQAKELIELSGKKKKVLMVDHTFLYTGAVQKMKEIIERHEIGKIKYFDSTRINLGLFQPDVNVLWDLAPHDISILSYLVKEKPVSVQSIGISHTHNEIENIAYMTLKYNSGMISHFHCSWTSPVKIRMTLIGGDKKMIVYNDLEPTEKIKIYDTGYHMKTGEKKQNILIDYRIGDVFLPKIENKEALTVMVEDFIKAILECKEPISNGELGLHIVRILEASQISIKNKGKEVKL